MRMVTITVCEHSARIVMLNKCLWLCSYWPGGFMFFVVLCPEAPEGSTGSGSGFKASQKSSKSQTV